MIKVVKENNCIGCEMCVMECQRQLKKFGLEGSYIRIMRNLNEGDVFEVSFDPKIHEIKSEKIIASCPRKVFENVESDEI